MVYLHNSLTYNQLLTSYRRLKGRRNMSSDDLAMKTPVRNLAFLALDVSS